jgi:group I intron endonuclease
MYTIYQITNKVNGKSYVGFTTENPPERRFVRHRNLANSGAPGHLYNAIRKEGIGNFSFLIREMGENEEYGRNIAESMYIAWLGPEYNKTYGGEGAHGCSPSLETRMKISKAKTGVKLSLEHVAAAKAGRKLGIPLSEENKKNISIKISLRMRGIPKTLEHRQKLSDATKKYWKEKKNAPLAQQQCGRPISG